MDSIATIADDRERRSALERAARELADALAHLHGRGFVHGDISPANVRLRAEAAGPRAVLIDFGLAGPPVPGDGLACGTLGYAAPEALTGTRSVAADLFALGATLYEAYCGAAPFGRGLAAAERMLAGPPPTISSIRPGLPEEWDRLFAALLAADPGVRPRNARELLRQLMRLTGAAETATELDLGVPYPEGDPLAGVVVGRQAERSVLRAALDRLAAGVADTSLVSLVGAAGSGRHTLFELVARDVAIAVAAGAMPAVDVWRAADLAALEHRLGMARDGATAGGDAHRAAQTSMARVAEALEVRARERPVCVWLDEGASASAFAAFWSGAPPSGHALLVVPTPRRSVRRSSSRCRLPPLGESDVSELVSAAVESAPSAKTIGAIAEASSGNAAIASALVRRLVAGLRAGRGEALAIEPGADLDAILQRGFEGLSPPAQTLVLATALAGGDASALTGMDAAEAARGRAEARSAGWLGVGPDGGAVLPSAAHRRIALSAAPESLRRQVGAGALRVLDRVDPRRTDALVAVGASAEAWMVLVARAEQAAADGDPAQAALALERARDLLPDRPWPLPFTADRGDRPRPARPV